MVDLVHEDGKFWSIHRYGSHTETRFGKEGSSGQVRSKQHDDEGKAEKYIERQIRAKKKNGYTEKDGEEKRRLRKLTNKSKKNGSKKKAVLKTEEKVERNPEVKMERPPVMKYADKQLRRHARGRDKDQKVLRNLGIAENYFMSEKLDGWHAVWDGANLVTKSGLKKYHIPDDWRQALERAGTTTLSGEIYFVGTPQSLNSQPYHNLTKKGQGDWEAAGFWVFDVPDLADRPFRERTLEAEKIVKRINFPGIKYLEQILVKDQEHLVKKFDEVVDRKGEGLVVTAADSKFTTGSRKATARFKLKPRRDAEAKVVDTTLRPDGTLKSLVVEWTPEGRKQSARFSLGTGFSAEDRERPGRYKDRLVTFSYSAVRGSRKPVDARFVNLFVEK